LLETGTYRRVGSTEQRHADIRVLSATHRDLEQMVAQGRFREDLYYRLSTFPIHLPALRERRDDIALLAVSLLTRVAPKRKLRLSDAAIELLQAQDFPGNVRELRNLLERSALLCDGDVLDAGHVEPSAATSLAPYPAVADASDSVQASTNPHVARAEPGALKSAERAALGDMLKAHNGSRAELAAQLGMSERSLYRKIKALKLP